MIYVNAKLYSMYKILFQLSCGISLRQGDFNDKSDKNTPTRTTLGLILIYIITLNCAGLYFLSTPELVLPTKIEMTF